MTLARRFVYRWLEPVFGKIYSALRRFRPLEMLMDFTLSKLSPDIGIPFLEATRSSGSMEEDWDNRARLNSLIAATGHADEEAAAGSARVALEFSVLKGINMDQTWKVLEIGCGVGNLLRPLSTEVTEAHGVDISSEMLRQARGRARGYSNLFLHKTEGELDMFPDDYFDFVYSSGVFIHFPSKPLVYTYFKEAARVLKPKSTFRFHVDGRSYLRWRSDKGGTLRGVVFNIVEIKENLESHGFQVAEMSGEGSIDCWTTAILGNS